MSSTSFFTYVFTNNEEMFWITVSKFKGRTSRLTSEVNLTLFKIRFLDLFLLLIIYLEDLESISFFQVRFGTAGQYPLPRVYLENL